MEVRIERGTSFRRASAWSMAISILWSGVTILSVALLACLVYLYTAPRPTLWDAQLSAHTSFLLEARKSLILVVLWNVHKHETKVLVDNTVFGPPAPDADRGLVSAAHLGLLTTSSVLHTYVQCERVESKIRNVSEVRSSFKKTVSSVADATCKWDIERFDLTLRPIWLWCVLVVPVVSFVGYPMARCIRKKRRRRREQCIRCGYDLRGCSEGCPECGFGRSVAYQRNSEHAGTR